MTFKRDNDKRIEFVARSHAQQIEDRNRRLMARLGFLAGFVGGLLVLALWWWASWR